MFDWDAANLAKIAAHHLAAVEVESAFLDPFAMDVASQEVDGEERQVLFGMTDNGTIIRVIFTDRGERVRVVTAHIATRGQQRQYAQHRLELLKG